MNHLSNQSVVDEYPSGLLLHRARPWGVRGVDAPSMIWIDNTIRYQLNGLESEEEFARLVPSGGPIIKLPSPSLSTDPSTSRNEGEKNLETHTVALFHQLSCIGTIRADYASNRASALSEHCLNYLRQTILCLADTRLEPVRRDKPPNIVILAGDYECRDWTALYKAAEENQKTWM